MTANSLLWEISKVNSLQKSFLLGTMHVRSEQAFANQNLVLALIDSVGSYVGEMDLNDPDMGKMDRYFASEQDLMHVLGVKKYDKCQQSILKAFGIDIDQLAGLKPIIVANAIAESVLTKDHELFLDGYLWNYAMSANKSVYGLESVQDQVLILENIPLKYQVESLIDIGKNPARFRRKIKRLTKAYNEGRANDLYKMSKKSLGSLRHLMLYDRNKVMAERLMQLLSDVRGGLFASVGAAHLGGNKGIVALLKKEGYKLKPIS